VLFFSLFKIWLSFAPVADLTAKYYKRSLDDINWLSIVYLLSYLLFGLVAVWILDVLGLRTGVRISFTSTMDVANSYYNCELVLEILFMLPKPPGW